MKEFYPYMILPQKVEKIMSEGIPLPQLPQLMKLPEPVSRRYFGTVIFILSLISLITFLFFVKVPVSLQFLPYILFFIALISLVASIFEFFQYSQLKKQYVQELKLYNENKEAFKKVKANQERINRNNQDEQLVKKYQLEKTIEFFSQSYDTINAIHNSYSLAKKRLKMFLDEYFPDEVLDHIKVVHSAKNLEYIPDFVIKFQKPKLNLAIEIEEPYSLSNVPENIQKDYEAKDRIRQRFANELGWIVIVISEEQSVTSPTECCKFIEDSIESVFGDIKPGDKFVHVKPIKLQKMLTGAERAHMKSTGYREKYLIEAGLMDDPNMTDDSDSLKNESIKRDISKIVKDHKTKEKSHITEIQEPVKMINDMDKPEEKKEQAENEQLLLIKRVAQKIKPDEQNGTDKLEEQESVKFKTDSEPETEQLPQEKEIQETLDSEQIKSKKETSEKSDELRKEDDILKDLYKALDKHSKRLQEKKEKRVRERMGLDSDLEEESNEISTQEVIQEKTQDFSDLLEEKSEQNQELESQKIIENETIVDDSEMHVPVIEDLSQEESQSLIDSTKAEEKSPVPEYQELEDSLVPDLKLNLEEKMEEKKRKEESLKIQEELMNSESEKNQQIIEEYREKIEGAVFDKAWDDLIDYCNEAIEVVPFWDWAYYRRSTAWGNKRQFDKAIEDCTKAIAYNPSLGDAYFNRGAARFFSGKFQDAADDYQKSIDLNYVKKAEAYFNRGLCFQKMELRKKAYLEFMKAKEMGSAKAAEILAKEYE
jgi:hypothetical protein